MNTKVLNTLEYNKVLRLLAEEATSEPGRKKCMDTVPSVELEEIIKLQTETDDAVARLLRNSSVNFGGMAIAGKTGTAETGKPVDDSWFVGMGPAEDCKVVVAIVLEEGAGTGASSRANNVLRVALQAEGYL